MSYSLTDEQEQAINIVATTNFDRLKIMAYAGAGKTTTIALMAHRLGDMGLNGIYLAFNKAIADEAGKKLPRSTVAKTFHSLAFNNVSKGITDKLNAGEGFYHKSFNAWLNLRNSFVRVTGNAENTRPNGKKIQTEVIDNYKQFMIVKNALDLFMRSDAEHPLDEQIDRAIDHVLRMKVQKNDLEKARYQIKPIVEKTWADFINPNGHFKISHDVYLKLYALQKPVIDYDFILFDESQDTDKLMLGILAQQKTRIIFVGDPYQQIYDWRGAVDAMSKFKGQTAYLTKSFRFGEAIAERANRLLDYLDAEKPLIGAGQVGFVDSDTAYPEDLQVILCRTNAGAISTAIDYYELHPNKKINLEFNGKPEEMLRLFKAFEDFEKNPASNRYHDTLSNFDNFTMLKDYCKQFPSDEVSQQLRLFIKYGYPHLERTINAFTASGEFDLTVTTAHKAKGREWDNVLICSDFEEGLMKQIKGKEPISKADARLIYVAITRPKKGLYIRHVTKLLDYIENFEGDLADENLA